MPSIMKISTIAFCICHATVAWSADYQVKRSLESTASPSLIWNLIGDFCDIDDWHPNVSGCSLKAIDGSVVRVLTTASGDKISQKRVYQDGLLYTYETMVSDLPIENYKATLSITPLDNSLIEWTANFSSEDPAMEQIVVEDIEGGMAAIEKVLGSL